MAGGVKDALRILDSRRPDFALLDVNLGPETSLPVAERLRELQIPFAFATGLGINSLVAVTIVREVT